MGFSDFNYFEKTIWLTRPDLQRKFKDDKVAFLAWLVLNGVQEYQGLKELYLERKAIIFKAPSSRNLNTDSNKPSLTCFMAYLWQQRTDLHQHFDINTELGQQSFIKWYFIHGIQEHDLLAYLPMEQVHLLLTSITNIKQPDAVYIPTIAYWLWQQDDHLQHIFPNPKAIEFSNWVKHHGQDSFPVLSSLLTTLEPHSKRSLANLKTEGVNLIGYAKGQLGIGEDVRMMALALESANIPYTIYNIEPGSEVDQRDTSVLDKINTDLPYKTNIFCVTGIENARLFAQYGHKLYLNHYNIGYWPWELSEWPTQWQHAYQFMDEVWASSSFAYEAYIKSCPCKVRHMPMAVDTSVSDSLTRKEFGLTADRFLFTYAFDFLSSVARKNPLACVRAFLKAFPKGKRTKVGLVIKCMRFDESSAVWRQLQELIKGDKRITLIKQTLTRAEVLDLYRQTDCFVSLHRSEGFGRGMADAMMVGRPVICTGYSGNLDFTTPASAALVDYTFVPSDDYPFGDGQRWAEPSIDHAAQLMQRVYQDKQYYQSLANLGQQIMLTAYTPAPIGSRYKAVLATLFKH